MRMPPSLREQRPSGAPGAAGSSRGARCSTTPADRLAEALRIAQPALDRVARHVPLTWELRARADGSAVAVEHRTRWSPWRGVLLCGGPRETAGPGDRATLQGEALYATANGRLVVVRYAGARRRETLTLRGSTRLLGRAVAARRFSTDACVAALEMLQRRLVALDDGTSSRSADEPPLSLRA